VLTKDKVTQYIVNLLNNLIDISQTVLNVVQLVLKITIKAHNPLYCDGRKPVVSIFHYSILVADLVRD